MRRVVEANGRSRIVLNLDQMLPYQTRVSGNDIIVTVGAAAQVASGSAASVHGCGGARYAVGSGSGARSIAVRGGGMYLIPGRHQMLYNLLFH